MEKLIRLKGPAAVFLRANIDTDVIIRIERLSTIARADLGQYAFESLRDEPDFPYARPTRERAPILLAGRNFGCGSSREGAVWALAGLGVRCVVAPSFGDIFFNNCFQNGVLPIVLPEDQVLALAEQAAGGRELEVDLQSRQIIRPDGVRLAFDIDALKRAALLEGSDDIAQTLARNAAICAWQEADRKQRPWVWDAVKAGA